MDNPYNIPLDFTGYGPSGAGYNPSPEERMLQQNNKFHSQRVAESMRYSDPYMQQTTQSAMRIMGANNDPAEVRRRMYDSAQGQAAQNMAMAGRVSGLIGAGNPVNYANNIMRGITGGGFGVGVMDSSGRTTGQQRVSGNGVLAERIGMNYARGVVRDLYGRGTPDPEKLSGFNMEEASSIFGDIARDSGLGSRAMVVQKNANIATRLDAARDAAVDPTIKEGLSKVKMEDMVSAEDAFKKGDTERLDKFLATINNPKVREEISAVVKSKDAMVVNDKAREEVSEAVKTVIKGLSGLKDIYGEMNAPQLKAQLQGLTGVRIKDDASAKRANNMMERLRGAAESSGMDPRAYLDALQASTADLKGRIGQTFGLDSRHESSAEGMAGLLRTEIGTKAGTSAKMAKNAEKQWTDLGFGEVAGSARNIESYQEDIKQGQFAYMDKYKGITLGMGNLDIMGKEDRSKAEALLAQTKGASADKMQQIENQMRNLTADAFGGGSFSQAEAGKRGRGVANIGANKFGVGDALMDSIGEQRLQDVSDEGIRRKLSQEGMSGDDSKFVSNTMIRTLGSQGLAELQAKEMDKSLSSADRLKSMRDTLTGSGEMSGEDADRYLKAAYDKDGRSRISKGTMGSIAAETASGWGDAFTAAGKNISARDEMSTSDSGSMRQNLSAKDGGLSLTSVMNAIMTKKAGPLESDEGKTLLLQTMKNEGMKFMGKDKDGNAVDLAGSFETGVDLSGGMTKEALEKLNKVAGKDTKLAASLGYGSDEEMFNKTKNSDQARALMYRKIRGMGGMSNTGGVGSMNFIGSDVLKQVDTMDLDQKFKGYALTRQLLNPNLSEQDQTAMDEEFRKTGNLDIHMQADQFDAKSGSGKSTVMNRANKFNQIAAGVNGMSAADLETMAKSGGGQQVAAEMEKQLSAFKQAKDAGKTSVDSWDDQGNLIKGDSDNGIKLSDAFIKAQEAAIAKLKDAIDSAKGVESVGVMKVDRIEVINPIEPKK